MDYPTAKERGINSFEFINEKKIWEVRKFEELEESVMKDNLA